MPSKSKKQHNFMEAIAHSPEFAKKAGVPQSVGKDFASADKGRKFKGGGMAKNLFKGKETYGEELKEAKALKGSKISKAQFVKGEKSEGHADEENPSLIAKEIKSGAMSPKQYASVEAKEKKMAKGGNVKNNGGTAAPLYGVNALIKTPATKTSPAIMMKKGGMTKGCGYVKGGGIEVRGKTKGKMC